MRSSRSLQPWPRRCTTPHEVRGRPGPGRRRARRSTRPSSGRLLLPSRCSSACTTKSPAGGGLPAWQSRRGHRSGSRGTPWSTSLTSCVSLPRYRSSMLLCRRRWTSCVTCSSSSTGSRPCPSRLSKCPRSTPRTSLCARFCVLRSWQNSWWKCRRSSPFL